MTRVTRGMTATITLLALLIGIPIALWALSGNPVPSTISLTQIQAAITSPDQGQLVLHVITWVAWIAWATFALSVLLEVPAQLRGLHAPRIPGLGLQQRGAHILIAAVIAMLSFGGSSLATASAAGTQPASATSSTAQAPADTHAQTPPAQSRTTPAPKTEGTPATRNRTVVVKPGDTLWDLAQQATGAGEHYTDLAAASKRTLQSDGRHLTSPDDIYAGWKITIPASLDKHATPTPQRTQPATPKPATPRTTAPAPDKPAQTPPTHITPQTGRSTPTPQPAPPTAHQTPSAPLTDGQGADARGGGAVNPLDGTSTTQATAEDTRPWALTATGLAGTAAAGVLLLLARRRAAQSRRRRPGRRIAMPEPAAAAVEADLRADADPLAASDLDLALRTLAAVTHARHQALPELRAARITPTSLELYLVDDQVTLPTPFTQLAAGVWQINREGIPQLLDAEDAETIAAPYPCLVTMGQDEEDAWVLINLEQVRALALAGDSPDYTQQVLAAMTLELIGSEWADDLRVTLVDVMEDAADALGSDRVTHVHHLDHVLASLEYLAEANAAALADAHLNDVAHARQTGVAPDTWTPHLLVLATSPTREQRDRIAAILERMPRLAIAALTAGNDGLADWVLHLNEREHTATLSPIDVQVRPQHLDPATYSQLIDTFRVTEADDVPGPVWAVGLSDEPATDAIPDATDDHQDDPAPIESINNDDQAPLGSDSEQQILAAVAEHDATHPGITRIQFPEQGPLLRLLGDVEIQRATGKRPQAPRRATELIAFLALHPSDSHEPLDAAMWPNQRVTATKRNGPVNQARTWLGTAADGHPYVAMVAEHGYRLAPDTACDWYLLRDLLGDNIAAVSTEDLRKALTMVSGQPLTVPSGRGTWAWAEADRQEMIAAVADVAHELATRALAAGDPTLAGWAAAKGLTAEPASEQLWRDQLRAAYQSAIPGRVQHVADQLTDTLEPIAGDLEPETLDLLGDLLGRIHRKVS